MIFGINTTRDISKLTAREITYNNFEISLMVFMPNITTNHAITNTNLFHDTFSGEYTAISINVVSAQEITQL